MWQNVDAVKETVYVANMYEVGMLTINQLFSVENLINKEHIKLQFLCTMPSEFSCITRSRTSRLQFKKTTGATEEEAVNGKW